MRIFHSLHDFSNSCFSLLHPNYWCVPADWVDAKYSCHDVHIFEFGEWMLFYGQCIFDCLQVLLDHGIERWNFDRKRSFENLLEEILQVSSSLLWNVDDFMGIDSKNWVWTNMAHIRYELLDLQWHVGPDSLLYRQPISCKYGSIFRMLLFRLAFASWLPNNFIHPFALHVVLQDSKVGTDREYNSGIGKRNYSYAPSRSEWLQNRYVKCQKLLLFLRRVF